ncbi:MAG: hypothetical protein ACREKL_09685 [Chthoniobacterales bacterium]
MSSQPIARPPAERSLFVAVTVLIIAALIQIVAAVIALVPRIDFDKLGRALQSHSTTTAPAEPAAPAPAPADTQLVNAQQANALLGEAEEFRKSGNLRGRLEALNEANRLVPDKASILYQIAETQFQLGMHDESVAMLKKIVAMPPSPDPADMGALMQAKGALSKLGAAAAQPVNGTESLSPAPPPEKAAPAEKAPPSARDDVGIPIGSVMGIVKAELLDGEPGHKNLRVAMKAASGEKIDPAKVRATVDFYEQDDQAQIQRNTAPSPSEWLSSPIDWAAADPEIFQVKYRMPIEDRGDVPPLQYYGYVVAIYYDGELQDQRADPPSLLDQYAPPLHKDSPSE